MENMSWFNKLPQAQQMEMLNGPAGKPPSGTVPNVSNPANMNQMVHGVTLTCGILCALLVSLRLYSKAFYHKKLFLEDGEFNESRSHAHLVALFSIMHIYMLTVTGLYVAALVSFVHTSLSLIAVS